MKNKKRKIFQNKLFPVLIFFVTLFMGIGYATVNSISMDIIGSAEAKDQGGVYITDVTYYENVNASIRSSKINNFYQTMLDSTISLAFTSTNSSITYAITIYNSTKDDYYFKDTLYSDEFYDNKDITFELIGLNKGDLLESGVKKTFYIKFKYVDNLTTVSNNVLNSYLNFEFNKGANLLATNFNSYNNALWKYRGSITKIIIENSITDIDGAISDDVSLEQDGSVMSRLVLNDDESTYTAYLQSDSVISLPSNSSGLFYNFMKLESIENINLLKTSKVTNMNSMFMNDVKLQILDVSSFNTSNVTNMGNMFFNVWELTSLNIKGFDTSKVTNMSSMFQEARLLTKLDVSSFNTSNVTSMSFMFYNCAKISELDVSKFNTSNVVAMNYMFGAVSSVTSLDLSNFNTSKVTSMDFMFSAMTSLTDLNILSFDTSKVTTMSNMFNGCRKIKTLDLSSFDMSNVTSISSMFTATYNLKYAYGRSEEDLVKLNDSSTGKAMTCEFVLKS